MRQFCRWDAETDVGCPASFLLSPFALPSLYPFILLKGWKAKPPMPSKVFLELLGHGDFMLQGAGVLGLFGFSLNWNRKTKF